MKATVVHGGYTLLEVLLATTVLVVGLAAVFGMIRTSWKKSVDASDLASVQLQCQTILNEKLADQAAVKSFAPKPLENLRHWFVALSIYPAPRPGLCVVHLTAQKLLPPDSVPAGPPYHLVRWVPDHRVQLPQRQDIMTEDREFDDPYQ